MINNEQDYLVKTIIVGDSDVGKSSVLSQLVNGKFTDLHNCTIGVDYKTYTINMPNNPKTNVKFLIWDTAGQERFRNITKMYYRGANVVLFIYDITDLDSFHNIIDWIKEIEIKSQDDPVKILVGNKSDLESEREVSTREAREFGKIYDFFGFYEISAKDNLGIKDIFEEIAEYVLLDTTKSYKKVNNYVKLRIDSDVQSQNNDTKCAC